jgi:hypothetical protein
MLRSPALISTVTAIADVDLDLRLLTGMNEANVTIEGVRLNLDRTVGQRQYKQCFAGVTTPPVVCTANLVAAPCRREVP